MQCHIYLVCITDRSTAYEMRESDNLAKNDPDEKSVSCTLIIRNKEEGIIYIRILGSTDVVSNLYTKRNCMSCRHLICNVKNENNEKYSKAQITLQTDHKFKIRSEDNWNYATAT